MSGGPYNYSYIFKYIIIGRSVGQRELDWEEREKRKGFGCGVQWEGATVRAP